MKLLDIIFESVVDLNEMPSKLTTDEFIKIATEKWNGKYTYDNVDYKGSFIKVMITCPIHGDFPQTPRHHLQGREGCKKCNQKRKLSKFVQRAQEIHFFYDDDRNKIPKYTYDNVNYINSITKVMITCPIHGDFPQTPPNHLKGQGCDKCFRDNQFSNTEDFIKKAQEIHFFYDDDGNKIPKYTYDNVVYVDYDTKVMITCPIHGDFPQTPMNHLSKGAGCRKCSHDALKSTTEYFVQRAQEIHFFYDDDRNKIPKYTYDNVVYNGSFVNVMITCPIHSPIHGDFPQTPDHHLRGQGCPWCNESKGEKRIKQILFEKNIKSIPFKKYDDCISYRTKLGLTKRCYKLEFDFYLSDYNTLIEFDGVYHFDEKRHRKQTDYITQVLNDREKNEYTKLNNIKLIRIGYLDIENIEEELMKGLDSNDQLYLSTKYPIGKGWGDTTIKV
jgi:uncharacterized phage-like protein YoqJ